jgi:cytochrome oxidase assembly protein ShyY1
MARDSRGFRLRFWPTLATFVGLVLLVSLGTWQLTRYFEKVEIEAERDVRLDEALVQVDSLADFQKKASPYNAVALRGELDPNYTFLFKHRVHDGRPGYWIGGVLRFAQGDGAVLINRGWVHRKDARDFAQNPPPVGEQTYVGVVHAPERIIADPPTRDALTTGTLDLARDITEWDTYDLESISEALTLPHPNEPTIVVLGPDHSGHPYPIASVDYVTEPYLTAERHLGYVLFWYATGIALLSMWLAYSLGYLGSYRR